MPDSIEHELQPAGAGRRKRRRRKEDDTWLKSAAAGRQIFWGVTALAILAAAYTTHKFRHASLLSGGLMVGDPSEQVTYLYGPPAQRSADGKVWYYRPGSGTIRVIRFDDNGRMAVDSCFAEDRESFGCGTVMGQGIGTAEDHLINRIGPPTSQTFSKGGKILNYSDLGLNFTMREFMVVGITKSQRSGRTGFLPRVAWYLLP